MSIFIVNLILLHIYLCAEHAGLLHRYTRAMVLWCFAASINLSSTLGISPNTIPTLAPYLTTGPVCDVPLPVSMCSHCSAPTDE